METICTPYYANIFKGKFEKKKKYFHIFTADLSIIYSFFGMEPKYNFKNSLRSLTIAIL